MYKLDAQGNFIEFKGNTIICPITQEQHSEWYDAITKASAKIVKSRVASSFAMLPIDSIHTTIFGLVAEKYPQTIPFDLNNNAFEEIEGFIIDRLKPFFSEESKKLKDIRFKYDGILLDTFTWVIQIKFICLDRDRVMEWIKAAALACNMNKSFDGHYGFHTTLAYRFGAPKDPQTFPSQLEKLKKKVEKCFSGLAGCVTVQTIEDKLLVFKEPKLTFYRSMTKFEETPLYAANVGKNDWVKK